jgi:hypothetical protein
MQCATEHHHAQACQKRATAQRGVLLLIGQCSGRRFILRGVSRLVPVVLVLVQLSLLVLSVLVLSVLVLSVLVLLRLSVLIGGACVVVVAAAASVRNLAGRHRFGRCLRYARRLSRVFVPTPPNRGGRCAVLVPHSHVGQESFA